MHCLWTFFSLRILASIAPIAAMDPKSPVRRTASWVKRNPHKALAAAILLAFLAFLCTKVWQTALVQWLWWHSWWLRSHVGHTLLHHLSWWLWSKMFGWAEVARAFISDLCGMFRSQSSESRLRASLARQGQKTVKWDDDSVWTPDTSLAGAAEGNNLQYDLQGVPWRRAMGAERANVRIFDVTDTPQQSRHPTPQAVDHEHFQ